MTLGYARLRRHRNGRLGRPVTLAEMIAATADLYQREIDEQLGLL